MPTRDEIIKQLKALGSGGADFDQFETDRKSAAIEGAKSAQGESPDNGYCHGVCLDWVRRVLQGGRPSFGPDLKGQHKEGYDHFARRQRQGRRQGYAWAQFEATSARIFEAVEKKNAGNRKEYDQDYEAYTKNVKAHVATFKKVESDLTENKALGDAHMVNINYGALLQAIIGLKEAPKAITVGELRLCLDLIKDRHYNLQAPVQQPKIMGAQVDQLAWKAFTKDMDSNHNKKKRPFGGIDLKHVHPKKHYTSMQNAVASVTNPAPTDFQSGRAMIVGFFMKSSKIGDTGHAVAVHWHPNDRFVLLDPNYGVFVYEKLTGAQSVSAALNYLGSTAYPEPGLTVLNDIDYEIYAKKDANDVV